jgi:hypothetical protein
MTMVYKQVQQNSFNLTFDNLEILIIQHLRKSSCKTGSFTSYQKKASSMKQADIGTCSEKPPTMYVLQLLWDLPTLVCSSINFFSYEDYRKYRKY